MAELTGHAPPRGEGPLRDALGPLRVPGNPASLLAAAAPALATMCDDFVSLSLQRRIAIARVYAVLAAPVVMTWGQPSRPARCPLLVYPALLPPAAGPAAAVLFGAHHAAGGVPTALAGTVVSPGSCAGGRARLAATSKVAWPRASLPFVARRAWRGIVVVFFALVPGVAIALAAAALAGRGRNVHA